MAVVQGNADVQIGDEIFSLTEVPGSETALVRAQIESLLGDINLESLVADLGRVGQFVRLAYNGVAGYTDLQIKIRDIGYNVAILCDKSAVTVTKFKQASGSIIEALQSTYEFLLEGFDDMASECLASTADIAEEMAKAANDLAGEFYKESQRVENAWSATKEKHDSEEKRKTNMAKQAVKYEEDVKAAHKKQDAAQKDLDLHTEQFLLSDEKQLYHESRESSTGKDVANAFVGAISFGKLHMFDTEAQRAKAARKEKLQHLEEMRQQRETRARAIEDIAKFTKLIQDCKDDSQLAKVAVNALHETKGVLQHLSTIMTKTAHYWELKQAFCKELASNKVQRMISKASQQMSEEKRIARWTSRPFKKIAIGYFAKWVALDNVCGIYMKQIDVTQKSLYAYLRENPTLEDSREIVRRLAEELGKELAKERKAIEYKNCADKEEKEKLDREEAESVSED